MEGSDDVLAQKVQALSDLELALLISLVADQHCIIEVDKQLITKVKQELILIASAVFGLTCATLDCNEQTTLDDFGNGILVVEEPHDYVSFRENKMRSENTSITPTTGSPRMPDRRISKSPRPLSSLDDREIANVIVAYNLNKASPQVQIHALELIRGKRNFTRTAVHAAPRPFLFIALNIAGTERLTMHLNDQFFISHKHQYEDGLPNLEELEGLETASEDESSSSSIVHTLPPVLPKQKPGACLFSPEDFTQLATLATGVKISSEVRAYLHNIVVFMRLHRAVAGGVSAMATRHFNTLVHTLAPLHAVDYITPSLVALAARKIYPHRIILTAPENERSMQWGSSLEAVKAVLDGITVEEVIDEVLHSVEAPL